MQNSDPQLNRLPRLWLLIGIAALAVAGLFSLLIVLARTPSLATTPLFNQLFHQALVVHVDLSVLVWFLSSACMLWSLRARSTKPFIPYLEESALICFALGTLAIAFSPLDSGSEALMSNYIPVITSPVFFLGLSLLFCGTAIMLVRLFSAKPDPFFETPLQFGLLSAAVITLIALAAFFWSYRQMPSVIDGTQYYEMLFWGGGHLLQFTHVQIAMICWLLLARGIHSAFYVPPKHLYILFAIGLLCAFTAPFIYMRYGVEEWQHRAYFSNMMILANGMAPTILALWILPGVLTFHRLRHTDKRALWSALLMSFILFIYGGVLGALIEGQNVVIPAHYHGSIVGVTLAFMGVTYLLLPEFGCRNVAGWRLAYWQPIIYGGGQLLHISGLAWSGGYGVLRKTPGVINEISPDVKAAMGLMGLGGVIAIIGGLMFVVVAVKAVLPQKN